MDRSGADSVLPFNKGYSDINNNGAVGLIRGNQINYELTGGLIIEGGSITYSIESDSVKLVRNGSWGNVRFINKIDVTDFSYLFVTNNALRLYYGFSQNENMDSIDTYKTPYASGYTNKVDIRSITGEYYLKMAIYNITNDWSNIFAMVLI